MKRINTFSASLIGLLALYAIIYIWQPGGGQSLNIITNVLNVALSALATWYAVRAGLTFEPSEPQRRVWMILGAGLGLWAAAEAIWAVYDVILGLDVPYPSAADIFWVIGYIPLFLGLLLQYRALGVGVGQKRIAFALMVYAVLATLAFIVVLWPMLSEPGEGSALELGLNVLYPIGDLCLAFIATLSLLALGRGLLGRPWQYIVIGMLIFAVADLVYVYGEWNELYMTGSNLLSGFMDVAYATAYVVTSVGAYRQANFTLANFKLGI